MKKPKKRTAEAAQAPSTLLSALRFVGAVTKSEGAPYETHIHLGANWATAFNGTIAAGHPITEDIYCCPHYKIIEALSKCGEHISFTQLDASKLSIKSDRFKAIIPCIDPTLLNIAIPDPPVCPITDAFKEGLSIVGTLASENGQFIYLASILMNGQSLIATNGKVVMEYWHGINLPSGISIPKALVEPLNCKKKLAQFGFSKSSVTFYFEDSSWIRSQLYAEKWPDMSLVLDKPSNAWPVSEAFWKGLDAVAGFTDTGFVYFDTGMLRSHDNATQGACFEVAGLPKGPAFSAKYLAMIRPYAKKVDWLAKDCCLFFGPDIRGTIAGVRT
jgi:hypothetical protein